MGAGVFASRKGIADSGLLGGGLSHFVVTALAVMAVARFVPVVFVQFYVQGIAGILALWPLAFLMWKAAAKRLASEPRPVPAM